MIRHHHERWDGNGYPDGLGGDDIPLAARILTVADVYDALTTTRSYRPAFSPAEAWEVMESEAGRTLDPALVPLFRSVVRSELEPAGPSRAVAASSNGIVITDPRLPDNPIVYVNPAFEKTILELLDVVLTDSDPFIRYSLALQLFLRPPFAAGNE
jgi:hypothetical protein